MSHDYRGFVSSFGGAGQGDETRPNDPAMRGSYRAMEAAPRTEHLWTFTVRWRERGGAGEPGTTRQKTIPYFHLGEIDHTGTEHLSIVTTYSLIHLEGRNLSPLIAELTRRRVEALQEWDSTRWERPATTEPIISRVWVEPLGSMGRSH